MKFAVGKLFTLKPFLPILIFVAAISLVAVSLFPKDSISSQDLDLDGCQDGQEALNRPDLGGMRDPNNYWDFYDVPNTSGVRDGQIDLFNDIFGVANRFGATDRGGTAAVNRYSNPRTTPIPPAPAYHPAFDRSPNGGPPDGTIDLFTDVFGVAFQFGHSCTWITEWTSKKAQLTADTTQTVIPEISGTPVYQMLCYLSQQEMDLDEADGQLYPHCSDSQIAALTPNMIAGNDVTISQEQVAAKLKSALTGPIFIPPVPPEANSLPAPLTGASATQSTSGSDTGSIASTPHQRPDCSYYSQSDFKMGTNNSRLGWDARNTCLKQINYMGLTGILKVFHWDDNSWHTSLNLGSSGDEDGMTNSFRSNIGYGPIPPYLGVNCRRVLVKYYTFWVDFTVAGDVPGEGWRYYFGWTGGQCW